MRVSAESIRRHFLLRYGESPFESIANLFAEVQGDTTQIDLSSVPAWAEFAAAQKVLPRSEVLSRAFLWCIRHRHVLEPIRRPTIPPNLEKLDDPAVIRQLFEYCPYFLSNSQEGFRCSQCFDDANKILGAFVASMGREPIDVIVERLRLNARDLDTETEASLS